VWKRLVLQQDRNTSGTSLGCGTGSGRSSGGVILHLGVEIGRALGGSLRPARLACSSSTAPSTPGGTSSSRCSRSWGYTCRKRHAAEVDDNFDPHGALCWCMATMQEKRVGKKQRNHQLADQETARKREGIRKAIPTKVSPKNGNYVSVLAPSSLRKPFEALQSVRRKQERPHFDQPIHVHKHNPHNTTKSTCGHQERSAVTVADRQQSARDSR